MSMLGRRLQILIDDERAERLAAESRRQGVPVSVVVRNAIDAVYPSSSTVRAAAGRSILDADPMPVPDPDALRSELEALRGRRA
jgi:hypothetical protein